jgi:hypothetical protein
MFFWEKENVIRTDIYEKLIQVARLRSLISYDDLNRQLNLGLNFDWPPDRDLIGLWLGDISESEFEAGRHMLSALVGHKEGTSVRDPGKGFYELAINLGTYSGGDDLGFWAKEVKWLHSYWKTH